MNLDFSMALRALKNGDRVSRAGWNGKGMWLSVQRPDPGSLMTLPYIYMRTAQGDMVPWLASQTDLLAEDWQIVPQIAAIPGAPDPVRKIVRRVVSAALDEFERERIDPRSANARAALLATAKHQLSARGLPAPGDLSALIAAELGLQEA
ncbi:DUF2829 domain-containing protein [Pseudogemmobacter sonorensis]|uniref:DUF2829 domain-containing protein n=1 Tax=Pseudogemmobacter sonorensis TaxID=2989681 RepID=UPI00367CB895